MEKRTKAIRLIWYFIEIMVLMTGLCSVVSEQKKSVVVVERVETRGVLPISCLHDIREAEGSAGVYVLEETGTKTDPYLVREKRVVLKGKTQQSYLITGIDISGVQPLVFWSSGELADGDSVRLEQRDKLEKSGSIIFVNRVSGERIEQSFFGIPQEVEAQLRESRKLDENWRCFLFAEDGGESTPAILKKLLWFCVAFYFIWIFLQWDVKKSVKGMAEKRKRFYLAEIIERDMVKLLPHVILWSLLFWMLCMLAFACCRLDYGFLAAWLPEDRTIDISHYRMIFDIWKADLRLYLDHYDDGYAEILRKNLGEWKGLGGHAVAAAALLVGHWVYCRVKNRRHNRKSAGK